MLKNSELKFYVCPLRIIGVPVQDSGTGTKPKTLRKRDGRRHRQGGVQLTRRVGEVLLGICFELKIQCVMVRIGVPQMQIFCRQTHQLIVFVTLPNFLHIGETSQRVLHESFRKVVFSTPMVHTSACDIVIRFNTFRIRGMVVQP